MEKTKSVNKFVIKRCDSPSSFRASLTTNHVLIIINKKDDIIDVMQWVYAEMKRRNCFRELLEVKTNGTITSI